MKKIVLFLAVVLALNAFAPTVALVGTASSQESPQPAPEPPEGRE